MLLVCYTSIINEFQISLLTDERRKNHYNDLLLLVESSSNKKLEYSDDNMYDVIKMLNQFNVGTERPKFYVTETNPAKHGRLNTLNLESYISKSKKGISYTKEPRTISEIKEDNDIANWTENIINPITYRKTFNVINCFNQQLQMKHRKSDTCFMTNLMGFRLIDYRKEQVRNDELYKRK